MALPNGLGNEMKMVRLTGRNSRDGTQLTVYIFYCKGTKPSPSSNIPGDQSRSHHGCRWASVCSHPSRLSIGDEGLLSSSVGRGSSARADIKGSMSALRCSIPASRHSARASAGLPGVKSTVSHAFSLTAEAFHLYNTKYIDVAILLDG